MDDSLSSTNNNKMKIKSLYYDKSNYSSSSSKESSWSLYLEDFITNKDDTVDDETSSMEVVDYELMDTATSIIPSPGKCPYYV